MGPSLHIRVCCDVCLFVFCVLFNKAVLSSVFHTHTTEVFRVTPPAEEKSTHPLPTTASQPNPSMRWGEGPCPLGLYIASYSFFFAAFCVLHTCYLLRVLTVRILLARYHTRHIPHLIQTNPNKTTLPTHTFPFSTFLSSHSIETVHPYFRRSTSKVHNVQ